MGNSNDKSGISPSYVSVIEKLRNKDV